MSQLWRLTTARRKAAEKLGVYLWSRPSQPGIMECLKQVVLPVVGQGLWFLEAGGVDGFFESNTYELERFYNATGCIVEPNYAMFSRISVNRPKVSAINAALVEDEAVIRSGRMLNEHAVSTFLPDSSGADVACPLEANPVPTRDLASILAELDPPRWDLLSLDIEGYELPALKGIDFDCHYPQFILVEALTSTARDELCSYLGQRYDLIETPTYRDLLFRCSTL